MKIAEIINPNFRSGIIASGKKNAGQPWSLMQIKTDDGKEATIFSPAAIGDEIKLTFNEQYQNYNAEKLTPAKQEKTEMLELLNTILSSLGRIEKHLQINPAREAEQRRIDDTPKEVLDEVFGELPPVENYLDMLEVKEDRPF